MDPFEGSFVGSFIVSFEGLRIGLEVKVGGFGNIYRFLLGVVSGSRSILVLISRGSIIFVLVVKTHLEVGGS